MIVSIDKVRHYIDGDDGQTLSQVSDRCSEQTILIMDGCHSFISPTLFHKALYSVETTLLLLKQEAFTELMFSYLPCRITGWSSLEDSWDEQPWEEEDGIFSVRLGVTTTPITADMPSVGKASLLYKHHLRFHKLESRSSFQYGILKNRMNTKINCAGE